MSLRFPNLGLHGTAESRIGQEVDNIYKEKQGIKHKTFKVAPKAVDVAVGGVVIIEIGADEYLCTKRADGTLKYFKETGL